jgi:subtilisin family serine protease
MKYNNSLVLFIVTILCFVALFGFEFNKLPFTNFYYYEGEPYRLIQVPDAIFIEINNGVDQSTLSNLLTQYPDLYLKQDFSIEYKKDFVFINRNIAGDELRSLIENLNERPEIINASPVFRMPDGEGNSKTLIGVEKEIIAQFKPVFTESEINSQINKRGLFIVQEFDLSGGKTYLMRIPKGEYSIEYANELYLSGLVNYAEPNLYFTNLLQADPNDPFFPQQWSHRNTGNNIPGGISGTPGCDMQTDSAWTITMGSPNVIVSVVDTGIDTLHEDLHERIINGLSINTYSNLPYAWDDNNHGTSCSGIIAATGNNNLGVIGVAPLSRIFGVKIFNSAGNTNSTAIIDGLIAAWQRGSWVSSNSWGGGSPISAADNAILDGVTLGRNGKGVVWSFASGNGNTSSISWPSTNSNVISVGGNSPCNQRKSTSSCDNENWWGSQYGTGLEIVAPCVKIYTTDRSGSVGYSSGNYFSTFNGTSSATPNVSGVAALILAVDSSLTWDKVREYICLTADKVGAYTYNQPGQLNLGGWNNQMGYGKINAYSVVDYTLQNMIPVELTSFSANINHNNVILNWETATEVNNSGFNIERKNSNEQEYQNVGFIAGKGTTTEKSSYSFTDMNLKNGTYFYRLKQVDFNGSSEYSNEIYVDVDVPVAYKLEQNYPNPFNPSTLIKYAIPQEGFVSLIVYNLLGEKIATLVNEVKNAGNYEINFDASQLSSGVYLYKLDSGNSVFVRKMLLMK